MKLIVGLGNPGRKYIETRHNIGFQIVQEIAKKHTTERPKARFHGETVDFRSGTEKVVLLCPLTYMNASGKSVRAAVDFFQLESNQDLLVICDDFNLDFGRIRLRRKGSSGGQKGLEDIIRHLGDHFCRLRVGIGAPPSGWNVPDYVLSKFKDDEREELQRCVERSADAVTTWVTEGPQTAMNRFNIDPKKEIADTKKSDQPKPGNKKEDD